MDASSTSGKFDYNGNSINSPTVDGASLESIDAKLTLILQKLDDNEAMLMEFVGGMMQVGAMASQMGMVPKVG